MESKELQFKISTDDSQIGCRLDKYISLLPEIKTRSRATYLFEKALVFINGRPTKSSYKIKGGEDVLIKLPQEEISKELRPLDINLDIRYEDDDLLVVNKPVGLVVHPAAGHSDDTLVNALVSYCKSLSMKFGEDRPGIVHRLDKETSGLLVVAKNDFSHENLAAQFKERSIHRIYYAVCLGISPKGSGTIISYLARHPVDRKRYASIQKHSLDEIETLRGKRAITHYKVLQKNPSGIMLIQIKLETGRTHQIRVHMSEAGFPIVGDRLYGADKKLSKVKGAALRETLKSTPHFLLHAAELGFSHPKTGKNLCFRVGWPAGSKKIITDLGIITDD